MLVERDQEQVKSCEEQQARAEAAEAENARLREGLEKADVLLALAVASTEYYRREKQWLRRDKPTLASACKAYADGWGELTKALLSPKEPTNG